MVQSTRKSIVPSEHDENMRFIHFFVNKHSLTRFDLPPVQLDIGVLISAPDA